MTRPATVGEEGSTTEGEYYTLLSDLLYLASTRQYVTREELIALISNKETSPPEQTHTN